MQNVHFSCALGGTISENRLNEIKIIKKNLNRLRLYCMCETTRIVNLKS